MVLSGKITDKTTGEGLPFVNVYFSDSSGKVLENQGTQSDWSGNYEFDYIGGLWVSVSCVGYGTATKQIPDNYDNATLNFELSPGIGLPEVVIKAIQWKKYIYIALAVIVVSALLFFLYEKFR